MLKILYVEDDPGSRRVVSMAERMNPGEFEMTIYEDSTDFEARFLGLPESPDLVLLDIHVKPHTGFDMLKMIRKHRQYDAMPVVAPTNILVMQQLLTIEDVACVTLSSTRDLSYQLDSITNVQVVFLDLEMPGIDGYDALPLIKQHPNFRESKVIAYSVHVSELHTVLEMGFDGFLGKPLSAEAFPDQLRRILAGEQVSYIP